MVNTKVVVVLLLVASVLVAAIIGIAFIQLANAQANLTGGIAGQVSQGGYGYYPQQGYSSNGDSFAHSHGMGTGMCGRFW